MYIFVDVLYSASFLVLLDFFVLSSVTSAELSNNLLIAEDYDEGIHMMSSHVFRASASVLRSLKK